MNSSPVNIFQRLMRKWETVHPYNAAQVMEITGDPYRAGAIQTWSDAWRDALRHTGIGRLQGNSDRYHFAEPDPNDAAFELKSTGLGWVDHVSAELDRPFEADDPCVLRPFIAAAGENTFAVGVVYRHWVADSVSIRMLLREWFLGVFDPTLRRTRPVQLARWGYWNTVGPGRRDCGIGESIVHAIRRQTRLRRAKKIGSRALNDLRTRFVPVDLPIDVLGGLKTYARRRGVGLNDVFIAALAETCARHVPLQPRPSRREVAVGAIVDLRSSAADTMANVFGLFLGFSNVICQPSELNDFDRLVSAVARQTRNQKSHGIAACSLMWMTAAATIGRWSKPDELYHFYRKDLPLAGGSSNVDLSGTWAAAYWPHPLRRYVRVSPTGPMIPLVVTTTTLGDRLDVGLTHRVGLIAADLAGQIGRGFAERLITLASAVSNG